MMIKNRFSFNWLVISRDCINKLFQQRCFNCGGDNFTTNICYNYVTSTKSNKIKIAQVYKIISQMFDYCNDDD
jgi:hypothetical protein